MRGEEIAYVASQHNFDFHESEIQFVNIDSYPNGDPLINNIPTKMVRRVLLRPKSMLGFTGGVFWIESMIERGLINNECFELIIPFVPGSRQDRMNSKGDALFTIKSVARMINSLRVCTTILDPHSDVTSALINKCTVIKQLECQANWITSVNSGGESIRYQGVISPDAGAEKKAGEIARMLKIPLIHAWKTRDVATGNITGFGSEFDTGPGFEAGKYLIVDDICDGGGTFIGLVDSIQKYPKDIKFDLSVTHGLFTKGTQELLKRFETIYCTDSVAANRPGIQINQMCSQLLLKGTS